MVMGAAPSRVQHGGGTGGLCGCSPWVRPAGRRFGSVAPGLSWVAGYGGYSSANSIVPCAGVAMASAATSVARCRTAWSLVRSRWTARARWCDAASATVARLRRPTAYGTGRARPGRTAESPAARRRSGQTQFRLAGRLRRCRPAVVYQVPSAPSRCRRSPPTCRTAEAPASPGGSQRPRALRFRPAPGPARATGLRMPRPTPRSGTRPEHRSRTATAGVPRP